MKSVIDHNNDDFITSKEILSLKVKEKIIEENSLGQEQIDYLELRLHNLFNQFDNDKDGTINIEDIRYITTNKVFPNALRISKVYVTHSFDMNIKYRRTLNFKEFYNYVKRSGEYNEESSRKLFNQYKGEDEFMDITEFSIYLTLQELGRSFKLIDLFEKKTTSTS